MSKTGCYVCRVGEMEKPFQSYPAAKAHADELGTEPGRWSLDHPIHNTILSNVTSEIGVAA